MAIINPPAWPIDKGEKNALNILLNAFRIAINGALSVFGMVDGFVDEFEDETGIDTGASSGQTYDASGDFYSNDSEPAKFDEYASTNQDADVLLIDAGSWYSAIGQAFTLASDKYISSVKIWMKKSGSPTDNFSVKLTAVTGSVGSTAVPTGSVLGTSGNVASSSLGSSYGWVEFTFASPVLLAAGTYAFYVDWTSSDTNHYPAVGADSSAPSHAGNLIRKTGGGGSWGAVSGSDAIFEIYGSATLSSDMELISEAQTAEVEPKTARIVLFEEDVEAVTINTDLKAYVSRDDGTTWTQITLTDEGDYGSGKRILTGQAGITAQPSGTDMCYKIETLNSKLLKIHGVALTWD